MKVVSAIVILALAFAGCATPDRPVSDVLPGSYGMIAGGFNEEMSIELKPQFTYVMDHSLIACDLSGITRNREEGTWKFEGGIVLLEPKAQTPNFPNESVFAPAAFRRLTPKYQGSDFLLVNPDYPERCVLKKMPNQAPEPTRGAVTIPADAGLAPAPRAAHL